MFARHGIPDAVVSDNGPQYASAESKDFAERWEFTHTTSSPGPGQSNGQAGRAVLTIKNLLSVVVTPTVHCWSIGAPRRKVLDYLRHSC